MLIKACFEPPDTMELVSGVVNTARMRSPAEVITFDTVLFHPLDDFPLQAMTGAVGRLGADAGAVFI